MLKINKVGTETLNPLQCQSKLWPKSVKGMILIVPFYFMDEVHMNPVSFKQRICSVIIDCAADFQSIYVDYEYLIYSEGFKIQPYYIIAAMAGNYKHLTGVNSAILPFDFFKKCLNGTLTENDFNFVKIGESENFVKGVVRNKILALPSLKNLLYEKLIAEEDFVQGSITCSLATANNTITIGFEDRRNARPKSLLRGNMLDSAKAVGISLVLRRINGSKKFDTIIQGDAQGFIEKFPNLYACDDSQQIDD